MFYRQKILVSLIEMCGGTVSNTDLQKLLFLFCHETGCKHYDFFPYKYGPFSFTSYNDRAKLSAQGILKNNESFALASKKSGVSHELKQRDYMALQNFVYGCKLRGRELLRYVYLNFPHYTSRSQLTDNLLSSDEREAVKATYNRQEVGRLYTIGYEGSSIDNYLDRLVSYDIDILVDVRRNPISRKYGFSKKSLQSFVNKVDIRYLHLPELGIEAGLRSNLQTREDYRDLFKRYAQTVLLNEGKALSQIVDLTESGQRVALTCFEADACMCHRHKIADFLKDDAKYSIVHI